MSDDSNAVPADPAGYKPIVTGHDRATVDTDDERYKSATAAAHKAGLSQAQFSQMLGFEASRVISQQSKAQPTAPSPAAPRKIEGYANMTMAQKLVAAGHV